MKLGYRRSHRRSVGVVLIAGLISATTGAQARIDRNTNVSIANRRSVGAPTANVTSLAVPAAPASTSDGHVHTESTLAASTPPDDRCPGLSVLVGPDGAFFGCTHGDDDELGASLRATGTPAGPLDPSAVVPIVGMPLACDGVGGLGRSVEVVYVRESTTSSSYSAWAAWFADQLRTADQLVAQSAAQQQGRRHIRWASGCAASIAEVVLSPGTLASFNSSITALYNAGYNRSDRKYLMLTDASVYCGIANLYLDDQRTTVARRNLNDGVYAMFARVDRNCWNYADVYVHELFHNFGAVQRGAPHATTAGHCWDEYDIMCYSDGGLPVGRSLEYLCPSFSLQYQLDCGKDDYFSLSPVPGSWLATHFNTADNTFLFTTAQTEPPIGVDDTFRLLLPWDDPTGASQTLPSVLANDISPDGLPLDVAAPSTASVGTLTMNGDGTFRIVMPLSSTETSTSFSYRASINGFVSNVVSVFVPIERAPTAPPSASVLLGGNGRPVISWVDAATNEVRYDVERSADGVTWSAAAALGPNITGLTDAGVRGGTTYRYRVRSATAYLPSAWATTGTVTTPDRFSVDPAPAITSPRATAPAAVVPSTTPREAAPQAG